MTVAVTGAAGKLGRGVVAELQAAGNDVRSIDLGGGTGIVTADLRDAEAARAALLGCSALVQLAAWPTPHSAPPATILADNLAITSNVLFAASELGIRRVVAASSQSVLGLPWAERVIPPDYLPVDEAHPCHPSDAYSVSKLAGEEIAAMFARRGELDVTVLRFPAIWDHMQFEASITRRLEHPEQGAKSQWAYIDVRDAARATRLALEANLPGFEIFNITSPRTFETQPLAALLRRYYPGVPTTNIDVANGEACFACRKAEEVLGFRARFVWEPSGIQEF
ncbi:MAG TPA: NAD(P)-dependent oxidoreductase [Devosia sp.]|jgi:nucleoside-diphosphate-sugar epimerase|nr:NAD(P)-dependent oxidoreductase [Devosia sp.]